MTTPHAQAVLYVFERLTAAGYTVISANTDAHADPQIFAQSETGELAFYFVRADAAEPTTNEHARFLALAAKHAVAAYYAPVALCPEPSCVEFRRL
jgi:hypothetical protein